MSTDSIDSSRFGLKVILPLPEDVQDRLPSICEACYCWPNMKPVVPRNYVLFMNQFEGAFSAEEAIDVCQRVELLREQCLEAVGKFEARLQNPGIYQDLSLYALAAQARSVTPSGQNSGGYFRKLHSIITDELQTQDRKLEFRSCLSLIVLSEKMSDELENTDCPQECRDRARQVQWMVDSSQLNVLIQPLQEDLAPTLGLPLLGKEKTAQVQTQERNSFLSNRITTNAATIDSLAIRLFECRLRADHSGVNFRAWSAEAHKIESQILGLKLQSVKDKKELLTCYGV